MPIPVCQVDAFTEKPFAGNPAAVCFLSDAAADKWMQGVAAEMNLPETAFLLPLEDGLELRWFTPTVEVDLCGHATLASAHALWERGRLALDQQARSCQRQVEMSYSLPSRNVLFWPAGWSAVARPPPVGHDAASECG